MVVNGCELLDLSIGCAGMIGEGRKTWMHTFNIVGSWLLAQTVNAGEYFVGFCLAICDCWKIYCCLLSYISQCWRIFRRLMSCN